jgi:hypothetical protein
MTSAVITPPPPPPAPAGPPPLTPGGRSTVRALIVVSATVLLIGTVTSLGIVAFGLNALRVTSDTQTLPAAMRSLTIDTGGSPGFIRIVADRNATGPRVDLRQVDSGRAGDAALVVTNDGTGTRVSAGSESSSFMGWRRGRQLTVTLPPELARRLSVTVQQEDGAVMAEADLDQLVARNKDGAVILRGAVRRVEIHSDDGAVITRGPISVSESFRADVTDGNISVEFKDAPPRTIDVTADDGNVSITLPPRGPYLVNASADEDGNTVVRVPQTSDRQAATSVVTARANDGNVTIDLPH